MATGLVLASSRSCGVQDEGKPHDGSQDARIQGSRIVVSTSWKDGLVIRSRELQGLSHFLSSVHFPHHRCSILPSTPESPLPQHF